MTTYKLFWVRDDGEKWLLDATHDRGLALRLVAYHTAEGRSVLVEIN